MTPHLHLTAPFDVAYDDRPAELVALEVELDRFFDAQAFSRTTPTRARYHRVRTRLLQFLDDVDVTDLAGPEAAARLAAERDRGRHGAFGRALGFEELLGCLGDFVSDPWLPSAMNEQRTHISLTERLARHLRRRQLVDPFVAECLFLDVLEVIDQARHRLRSGADATAWFAGTAGPWTGQGRALRLVRPVGRTDGIDDPQTRA